MTPDDMAAIEAVVRRVLRDDETARWGLLSYKDAAAYLSIPTGTLRSLVSKRQIPHVRIGPRSVTFDRAELDLWIASHKVAYAAAP